MSINNIDKLNFLNAIYNNDIQQIISIGKKYPLLITPVIINKYMNNKEFLSILEENAYIEKLKQRLCHGDDIICFSIEDISIIETYLLKNHSNWVIDYSKFFHDSVKKRLNIGISYTGDDTVKYVLNTINNTNKPSNFIIKTILKFIRPNLLLELLLTQQNDDFIQHWNDINIITKDKIIFEIIYEHDTISKLHLIELLMMDNSYNISINSYKTSLEIVMKYRNHLILNNIEFYLKKTSNDLITNYCDWYGGDICHYHYLLNQEKFQIVERLMSLTNKNMISDFYNSVI